MGLSQQTGKVQSTATASPVSIDALATTPSVGDIVAVGIAGYAGGSDATWTLSGYGVGTWHKKHLGADTGASPPRYAAMDVLWGYIDGTPSTACTATADTASTATIGVAVFSGIAAGATDTSTPAGKASTTSPSSTSYTAAASTKLLVSFFTDDSNQTATGPSSPWTALTARGGSSNQILQGAYIFGPTTGAKTASWAIGGDTLYTLGLQLDVTVSTLSASGSRNETVTLTADASAVKDVSGSRNETVTLAGSASAVKPLAGALDSTATLSASASVVPGGQHASGALDTTATLAASASAVKDVSASLDTTVGLTASASVVRVGSSASGTLDTTVDLSAGASLERSANAALSTHAGLTAAALSDKPASADLETTVALSASASVRAGIEIFECPSIRVQERPWTQDLALRFFTQDRAVTVLIHTDGSASEVQCPTEAELNDADVEFFFRGGYTHKVTSDESAALKAAGYTTSYV